MTHSNKLRALNQTKGALMSGTLRRSKHGQVKFPYAWRGQISKNARAIYKESGLPWECIVCKYSTIIEIAHIKPVAEFSPETTRGEINDLANLVALCPTHHLELDRDIISRDEILKLKAR